MLLPCARLRKLGNESIFETFGAFGNGTQVKGSSIIDDIINGLPGDIAEKILEDRLKGKTLKVFQLAKRLGNYITIADTVKNIFVIETAIFKTPLTVSVDVSTGGSAFLALQTQAQTFKVPGAFANSDYSNTTSLEAITVPKDFNGVDDLRDLRVAFDTGVEYRIFRGVDGDIIGGTDQSDTLEGGELDDLIIGKDGDDLLTGLGAGDMLVGEAGNDTIFGDAGNDTIEGGLGDDTIFGGAGADIFYIANLDEGIDTLDFNSTEGDIIQLDKDGIGATSIDQVDYDPTTGDLSFEDTQIASLDTGLNFNPNTSIELV